MDRHHGVPGDLPAARLALDSRRPGPAADDAGMAAPGSGAGPRRALSAAARHTAVRVVYSSSTGVQVVYLGLVPLPDLVPKDRELARALLTVHLTLNFTLLALVCVHTAAALKHHFVDRDTVLTRMLPPAVDDPGEG